MTDSVYEDPSSWRLKTTGSNIPYRIVSMEGEMEPESASAQLTLLVPSNKLLSFASEMFPAVTFLGPFPFYPARGRIAGYPLYASRIRWKGHIGGLPVDPFGIDSNAPDGTYQQNCEATVEFSTDIDVGGDGSNPNDPFTFLEVSCSGAGEFIHSTAPKAKWTDDEGAVDTEKNKQQSTAVSIIVPEEEWDVNWPRVPHAYYKNTLITKLRNALGKVNSDKMPIFFDAPKETILFVGYSLRQQYTWRTNTQPPFNLNLKFTEKHIKDGSKVRGHNDFWKADVGWQRLLIDGENPVYESTDLREIFKP